MASVLGTLRVILGGDNSGLDKSVKDSQSRLTSFGAAAGLAMAAVVAATVSAGAALGVMGKHAIDNADQVNKLSQSAGLSVQEFSKLKYAADLADVSTETLGKSMGKLSKAMASAASDGAGPAAQAFNAMGVAVKNQDGTLRSSSEVLADIATKFAGYRDGAAKTALAMEIFGKSGAAMIPLLNGGRDALKESADEAERFGVVLDKETTQAAENFNDNLTRMSRAKDGIVLQITARMLPALESLSALFVQGAKDTDLIKTASDFLTGALKFLTSEVALTTVQFTNAGRELKAFWAFMNADSISGTVAAWKQWGVVVQENEARLQSVKQGIADTFAGVASTNFASRFDDMATSLANAGKGMKALKDEAAKTEAPLVAAADATKNALQAFLDSQAKRTAAQAADAATVGKSVGEQARLRIEYEAQAIAMSKNIALTPLLLQQIAATGDAAALAAMKLQGAQLGQDVMNPAEKFQQQMDYTRQLLDAGVISLDTFGARQQQIAEQAGATWDIAGASMAGSFADISSAFSKESGAMATAAKVFGVIQGTISMFTGAAKALELPFPANIAAVAAVLAKGASLVASIKSQSVPTGMMTGGAMTVRGGGGPDSTPVQIMASPGEQIDVWRPDQGGGADPRRGAGGGTYNVAVPLVASRDWVREVFAALNEGMADGHRLNVVPV